MGDFLKGPAKMAKCLSSFLPLSACDRRCLALDIGNNEDFGLLSGAHSPTSLRIYQYITKLNITLPNFNEV